MNIAFFAAGVGDHLEMAVGLVASAKRHMPLAQVLHLTDETTPEVPGATAVRLDGAIDSPADLLDMRIRHYMRTTCDTIHVDTDVLFQADVSHVFSRGDWHVALTDRAWPHLPQPHFVASQMPFNTGVCFTRDGLFWAAVHEHWLRFGDAVQNDWMSEQRAVRMAASDPSWVVRVLPGAQYNFPPDAHTDGASALVVHYKGPRKVLMLERIRRELACASA